MNAVEIEEAISALAERPFDATEFPYAFLEAFGNKETTLKRLRSGASNKSDLGGVLQTSNIHIATCKLGEVTNTLALLKASPATARAKARFVLATDGDLFEAEDLTSDDAPISCAYGDFPNHFGFFLPLAGITTVKQVRESSFDIRATSRLNKLYVQTHGRVPQHGEEGDIFERLYAVRLDRLRSLPKCRSLLIALDHQGLLADAPAAPVVSVETMDDDELLAELEGAAGSSDITQLRHVRSSVEKREAEEIATREKCLDFENFKPLFQQVQNDLASGLRTTRPFVKDAGFSKAEITAGQFFILGGQTAYVASVGEPIKAPNGESDARLRVIYSNGTESDLLLRSLQRALYKDEAGRRITEPTAGPLFADKEEDGDQASGTIYVLRSKSDHPTVVAHRNVLHKIGVTSGSVEQRIANPRLDPTFLMADVELIATYKLYNINRTKLENFVHKVFGRARVDIEIKDRFGKPVVPKEWFLAPLFAVDEAVDRIKDGSITDYIYDPQTAKLVLAADA